MCGWSELETTGILTSCIANGNESDKSTLEHNVGEVNLCFASAAARWKLAYR